MRSLSPVSGISEIPQKEGESSIFLLWTLLSVDNTKKQIGMPWTKRKFLLDTVRVSHTALKAFLMTNHCADSALEGYFSPNLTDKDKKDTISTKWFCKILLTRLLECDLLSYIINLHFSIHIFSCIFNLDVLFSAG